MESANFLKVFAGILGNLLIGNITHVAQVINKDQITQLYCCIVSILNFF